MMANQKFETDPCGILIGYLISYGKGQSVSISNWLELLEALFAHPELLLTFDSHTVFFQPFLQFSYQSFIAHAQKFGGGIHKEASGLSENIFEWQKLWIHLLSEVLSWIRDQGSVTESRTYDTRLTDEIIEKLKNKYEHKRSSHENWISLQDIDVFWRACIALAAGCQLETDRPYRTDFVTILKGNSQTKGGLPLQFHLYKVDCSTFGNTSHEHTIFPSPRMIVLNPQFELFFQGSVKAGYEQAKKKRDFDSCLSYEVRWFREDDLPTMANAFLDGSSASAAVYIACRAVQKQTIPRPSTCYSLVIQDGHISKIDYALDKSWALDESYVFVIPHDGSVPVEQFAQHITIKKAVSLDELEKFAFHFYDIVNKYADKLINRTELTIWYHPSEATKIHLEEIAVPPNIQIRVPEKKRIDDLWRFLKETNFDCVVLEAPPGMGKSFLCQWTASQCASDVKEGSSIFPIYIKLNELRGFSAQTKEGLLLEFLNKEYALHTDENIVSQILQEFKLVFILDGYNELSSDGYKGFINFIKIISTIRNKTIVLSTRPSYTQDLMGVFQEAHFENIVLLELKEWEETTIQKFIENMKQFITLNNPLPPLPKNPFLATLFLFYSLDKEDEHDILRQSIKKIIRKGITSKPVSDSEIDKDIQAIKDILFEELIQKKDVPLYDELIHIPNSIFPEGINKILEGAGLVQYVHPESSRPYYSFIHPLFGEFLLAERLAEEMVKNPAIDKKIVFMMLDYSWHKTLFYMFELLEENKLNSVFSFIASKYEELKKYDLMFLGIDFIGKLLIRLKETKKLNIITNNILKRFNALGKEYIEYVALTKGIANLYERALHAAIYMVKKSEIIKNALKYRNSFKDQSLSREVIQGEEIKLIEELTILRKLPKYNNLALFLFKFTKIDNSVKINLKFNLFEIICFEYIMLKYENKMSDEEIIEKIRRKYPIFKR